jgi:hypothetical protein
MKGIKLTPLLLFVLLLVVLVISVAFGKMGNMEGFVAFQKEKSPLDKVWIPQYSKNEQVHKLNDNMFFDSRNGNLIELDAEEYSPTVQTTATTNALNTPPGTSTTQMPGTSTTQMPAMNTATSAATTDATQPYAKDTAMIITTAGVETAVRTAAPFFKEIADKKMGLYMIPGSVGAPIVQGAPTSPEVAASIAPSASVAPSMTIAPSTSAVQSVLDAARAAIKGVAPAVPPAAPLVTPAAPLVTPVAPAAPLVTPAAPLVAPAAPLVTPADPAVPPAAPPAIAGASLNATASEALTNMVDTTGVTITRVIISPRNGQSSTIYDITPTDIAPRDTNESKTTSVSSSYKSWKYESQCANTSKKTVFYIPWKENTYIIIVDKTDNNPYSLYMFGANNEVGHKTFSKQDIAEIYSQTMLDEKTNSAISEPLYNNQSVYKISKNVEYDIQRGNTVILPSGQGEQVSVYNRDGVKVDLSVIKPNEKGSISSVSFSPWIIKVGGKTAGFCMPHKDTTVICILGDTGSPALINVKRFNATGVDVEGVQQSADKPTSDVSESSDYILKTQIVPPVCPTCPACPGNVTCTNCGGQGGSGTLATDGKSIVGDQVPEQNGKRQGGLVRQVVSDTTGLAKDVVSGADDLVRDAASGTAGLAKDAVGGTVGLAKDAVGGTVGLAKDAVGGTVGLAKDVVGGTVGLAKDTVSGATGLLTGAVSGVAGLFKPNPTQIQNNQPQFQNNAMNNTMQSSSGRRGGPYGGQTVDNTTYFGALPDRPSANYMPITADFSAFSR